MFVNGVIEISESLDLREVCAKNRENCLSAKKSIGVHTILYNHDNAVL